MLFVMVSEDNPKAIELRWMWLPTFIGQNFQFMHELKEAWFKLPEAGQRASKDLGPTEEELRQIHDFAIDWICDRLKITGLEKYLRAIENVEE